MRCYRCGGYKYRRNSDEELRTLERRLSASPGDVSILRALRAAYQRAGRNIEYIDERLDEDEQSALEEAVRLDHSNAEGVFCTESSCDVSAALIHGFPEVSAHLLGHATECENVERATSPPCQCEEPDPVFAIDERNAICRHCQLSINGENIDIYGVHPYLGRYPLPRGWGAWSEWHEEHGVECPACYAFNFPNAAGGLPSRCGNCNESLEDWGVDSDG